MVVFCSLFFHINVIRISGFTTGFSRKASNSLKASKLFSTNANDCNPSRRSIINQIGIACTSALLPSSNFPAFAETIEETQPVAVVNTVPMKNFIDPKGLFALRVPQNFYTLRRTVKGDLPDAKTGKGRRGASIFTAGDMAKAEVVAVELFPTRALLEDEGIDATGDLSTFEKLGKPLFVAKLLTLRREKDKTGQTKTEIIPESVRVSDDSKSLYFELRTEVEVQKPELLMEQMGVSELVRVTLAKAELRSNNEQMMVVYASALDLDFNKEDGPALREVIDSFVAVDQSQKASS